MATFQMCLPRPWNAIVVLRAATIVPVSQPRAMHVSSHPSIDHRATNRMMRNASASIVMVGARILMVFE